MHEDAELLRRYVFEKSETAFAELVRRHINLVYSIALRQVAGDTHLAEDVTQQVFVALARKAKALVAYPALSGWLYRSTHFAASDAVRAARRRRTREQEAHMMTLQPASGLAATPPDASVVDWEALRPVLDAAIADLDECDRDAVSLRFFDQRSFAEVGARLSLSENAARMRVDRALDKLHGALTRRGVRSTAAALALALAHQATAVAPATLAVSVTGAALAGAAAGTMTTAGLIALMSSSKFIAGAAVAAAIVAGGSAVVERGRVREAETALVAVTQQQQALRAELNSAAARAIQSERRAAESEKDNSELLKAIEDLREKQAAARAAEAKSATTRAGGIVGMVQDAKNQSPEEAERVLYERAYQQELARQRAQEAIARASLDDRVARMDSSSRYYYLMETARDRALAADFQTGIRTFNQAMTRKPPEIPVTEEIKELQTTLQEQNAPVEVTLISDGETWVSITNFRAPWKFAGATTIKMPPGNYEVVGRRKGYRDVNLRIEVRAGAPPMKVTVICTVSIDSR